MMSRMPTPSEQVNGPATGLMVTAILGIVLQVVSILFSIFGMAIFPALPGGDTGSQLAMNFFSGTIGIVFSSITIALGVVILLGAQKMKRLESHGFAMAASIIALVPCTSPCCLLGIPIGIWALVVLTKPEVKSAFQG
jgi:hypothetical protein